MMTVSAPCKDERGQAAWAFDPLSAAWRPCVIIGPSETVDGRVVTPIRFCEGRVLRVAASRFSHTRPSLARGARILES
jgi:hypothetical protein